MEIIMYALDQGDVQPVGHIRPAKSFVPDLRGIRGELTKCLTKYSRQIFRMML